MPGDRLFLRGCDIAWDALLAATDVGRRMHTLCALHVRRERDTERKRAGRQVTAAGKTVLASQLGVYRALDALPLPVDDVFSALEAHIEKSRAYFAQGWLELLGSVVGEVFDRAESRMEHLSTFVVIETAISEAEQ